MLATVLIEKRLDRLEEQIHVIKEKIDQINMLFNTEDEEMVKVYARSCEKGLKLFTDVPDKLKDQVKAQIEADGYVINDDGTVTLEEA